MNYLFWHNSSIVQLVLSCRNCSLNRFCMLLCFGRVHVRMSCIIWNKCTEKKKVNTGITRIFRQHKFLEFRNLNVYDENPNSNFDFWYLFLFYEVVAESKITLWMDIRIIGIVGKLKPDILKAPSDYARKAVLCVARRHLTPPPSSTNVERLFSVGGLTAADHRASLCFWWLMAPRPLCGTDYQMPWTPTHRRMKYEKKSTENTNFKRKKTKSFTVHRRWALTAFGWF